MAYSATSQTARIGKNREKKFYDIMREDHTVLWAADGKGPTLISTPDMDREVVAPDFYVVDLGVWNEVKERQPKTCRGPPRYDISADNWDDYRMIAQHDPVLLTVWDTADEAWYAQRMQALDWGDRDTENLDWVERKPADHDDLIDSGYDDEMVFINRDQFEVLWQTPDDITSPQ